MLRTIFSTPVFDHLQFAYCKWSKLVVGMALERGYS